MKYTLLITVFLSLTLSSVGICQKKFIKINGTADFLKDRDTVELHVFDYGIMNIASSFHEDYIFNVKDKSFNFKFRAENHPQYINLGFKNHRGRDLICYVVEAGQAIQLTYQNEKLTISGKGSNAFRLQYLLRYMHDHMVRDHSNLSESTLPKTFHQLDSGSESRLKLLESKRKNLSKSMFDFLYMDNYYADQESKYQAMRWFSSIYLDSAYNPLLNAYLKYKKSAVFSITKPVESRNTIYSNFYVEYIIEKYKVDSCLVINKGFNIYNTYKFFVQHFSGQLREEIVTSLLCNNFDYSDSFSKAISEALVLLKTPVYREAIFSLNRRGNGAIAYDFILSDVNGNLRKFHEFKDRTVVLDFWFTGCGGCRQLAPIMRRIETQFNNKPVSFISISIDNDKKQWLESIQSGLYASKEILNLYTRGEGVKDPIINTYNIKEYPTVLIINPEGKIINIDKDPLLDNGVQFIQQINNCLNK